MKAIWFAKYRKIIRDGRCRGCREEERLTSSAMTA